jgi:hypothetical protein
LGGSRQCHSGVGTPSAGGRPFSLEAWSPLGTRNPERRSDSRMGLFTEAPLFGDGSAGERAPNGREHFEKSLSRADQSMSAPSGRPQTLKLLAESFFKVTKACPEAEERGRPH